MNDIFEIIIILAVVMFSASIHEVAHGWIALKEGDPTAKQLNRLTLNPLKHIDLFMTIILPIVFYFSAGFIFGGAKPVPINPAYFRDGRNSLFKVAAAGPVSNLILAVIGSIVFRATIAIFGISFFDTIIGHGLAFFLVIFININLVLFLFNLIPIPPLDGSKILQRFLSPELNRLFDQMQSYGMIILIVLLFTNILDYTIFPLLKFLFKLFTGVGF